MRLQKSPVSPCEAKIASAPEGVGGSQSSSIRPRYQSFDRSNMVWAGAA